MAAVAAIATGCSKSEAEDTPSACLQGPDPYLEAVSSAPAEVRLDGEVAISDCLPPEQGSGDLADVGSALVAAATRLNEAALDDPNGPATVQLGYLVGAAERGADHTAGIHNDLVLRLNTAAMFDPSGKPSPEFERAFERGYEAGKETG